MSDRRQFQAAELVKIAERLRFFPNANKSQLAQEFDVSRSTVIRLAEQLAAGKKTVRRCQCGLQLFAQVKTCLRCQLEDNTTKKQAKTC